MGQYYYGVILNRETRKPIMADYCGKLTESNRADMASFAYELSKGRKGYRQRVIWAGDYSEQEGADGHTLYDQISDMDEHDTLTKTLHDLCATMEKTYGLDDEEYELASKRNEEKGNAYFLSHIYNASGTFKQDIRYLCNHDRREYMDLNAYQFCDHWATVNNPLAILTSDPTCRIKGGGDYFYQEGWQYYSLWSGCILSTEPLVPEGYKEIKVRFECKTPIWTPDTISELITGEEQGYSLPSPSAYDFARSICRYDEAHCRLACVSREVILQMYADWQKKVDVERVYKAYDLLMRTIKKDPLLEQEHKGLKLEVRKHPCNDGTEYSDTYAIVDEVEMRLYGPYDNKWECGHIHQASLYGIKYDCDLKSRRYFRNLVKERQAVGK